jgi:hypothetical protein
MALSFDPAIAAHTAFERALSSGELGPDGEQAADWQRTFSESAGPAASQAYRQLLALGQRHPQAHAFQEFLIYGTWQQAAEDPVAEHFQRGAALCDRWLAETGAADAPHAAQIRALRVSFLNALGGAPQDEVGEEFDRDAFKGGD